MSMMLLNSMTRAVWVTIAALLILAGAVTLTAPEAVAGNVTPQAGTDTFAERLEAALVSDVPNFAKAFDEKLRKEFVKQAIETANEAGLVTEQGIASYTLAVLYAGPDFERKSQELEKLLRSNLSEARKVDAMNEWVNAMIGSPDDVAAADRKLDEALKQTEAPGKP